MNRKSITLVWMPSRSAKWSVFSIPDLLVCCLVFALLVSLLMVALGLHLGIKLQRDYLQLKEENTYLSQKKMELDSLGLAMKRIQGYEGIIRDVLGIEDHRVVGSGLGQGGMPATEFSSIAQEDTLAMGEIQPVPQVDNPSILDEAKFLQESLQDLVETIRERREILDSTPSIVPVDAKDYWFSSGFGWRRSPFTGRKEFHEGLDISAPHGTPIIAPGQGRVVKMGHHKYLGKYLKLDHGRKLITTYAHLSGFNVSLGQKIQRGQVIAYMGSSGRTTGPHLHYEIAIKGKSVNPLQQMLNAMSNQWLESPLLAKGGQ
jgi:murein DD-endopeptidase MepM/ murein hydrolase activator NlpD